MLDFIWARTHESMMSRGVGDFRRLLNALHNPQGGVNRIIHIAGTNGKGSTLAFLQSMLVTAGFKVNKYTSPHLYHYNERISLNGEDISDDYLAHLAKKVASVAEEIKIYPSMFEILTAVAFLAFSENNADFTLIETGLGGRYDSTNVVSPILSIITSISFDHTDILGQSLYDISYNKAGIIKRNSKFIIAKQEFPEVYQIMLDYGAEVNSENSIYGRNFSVDFNNLNQEGFLFQSSFLPHKIKLPNPSLLGEHQIFNAATAMQSYLSLQRSHPEIFPDGNIDDIESLFAVSLRKTQWKCRLQEVSLSQLNCPSAISWEINQYQCKIILDGSHNPAGGKTLAKYIKNDKNERNILIIAMQNTKDAKGFLQEIASEIDILIVSQLQHPNAFSANDLATIAKEVFNSAESQKEIVQAAVIQDIWEKLLLSLKKEVRIDQSVNIIFTGSLFFASALESK